jgi:hypothetical protein
MSATPPDILTEAKSLVYGDRHAAYGPPVDDFTTQAAMFSAYLSRTNGRTVTVRAEDIGPLMILVKVARQAHRPKRDNMVDAAGYAACTQDVIDSLNPAP